jgi:V/A-type H+/Na+-transporting ATPase subunit E
MTGLEKIISEITKESDVQVAKILDEAENNAQKVKANAKLKAEESGRKIKEEMKNQTADIKSRADSAAVLTKRKLILAAKQEIITETFGQALETLKKLPEKDYFDLVVKVAVKNALTDENSAKTGKIIFNKNDSARIPADFASRLSSQASKKNVKLAVSDETREIPDGFILSYGGIEVNCTFEALIENARESMQDEVTGILFGRK